METSGFSRDLPGRGSLSGIHSAITGRIYGGPRSIRASNTGWFSDRSACYLAAGRPVITQETGFGKYLPTGRGLFGFRTMEDILVAVDAIESDYAGNCRAAREIAAEYFAAEKVIGSLMERAGL